MKSEATIEAQIEAAWCDLDDHGGTRRYYFTDGGKLRHGPPVKDEKVVVIGTFSRAISLADFREEVFHVYGQLREAKHGGR